MRGTGHGGVDGRGFGAGRSNNNRANNRAARGGGGGGVAVSNACPQCGWFSRDIGDWDPWDGTIADD